MSFNVYFLPESVPDNSLAGRTVVVIDVLRATTTITQALAAGAREVIPCLEVDEARRIAASIAGQAILGGERGGKRIDGFDFGNSPSDYQPETVRGKTLVFTTTNGTRAMQRCRAARRVLLGCFNNLAALATVLEQEQPISVVCAGTDGQITREDVLVAGALMHQLFHGDAGAQALELESIPSPITSRWNDEAYLAYAAWREIGGRENELLLSCLLESRGGRNLAELGMSADVQLAAQIDSTSLVAELFLDVWRIRPARESANA